MPPPPRPHAALPNKKRDVNIEEKHAVGSGNPTKPTLQVIIHNKRALDTEQHEHPTNVATAKPSPLPTTPSDNITPRAILQKPSNRNTPATLPSRSWAEIVQVGDHATTTATPSNNNTPQQHNPTPTPVKPKPAVSVPSQPTSKKKGRPQNLLMAYLDIAISKRDKGKPTKTTSTSLSGNVKRAPPPTTNHHTGAGGDDVKKPSTKKSKKRLSTLKKRILSERKAVVWLQNPQMRPFPLEVHPALSGFACAWLKSEEGGGEEELPLSSSSSSSNEDVSDGDEKLDEINNGKDPDQPVEMQVIDASSDDDNDDKPALDQKPPAPPPNTFSSVGFDVTVASPIFFGCTLMRDMVQHTTTTLPVRRVMPQLTNRMQHSYITQALSPQLDQLVLSTLEALQKFQHRAVVEDPIKARTRKRLVFGLREVEKGVRLRRCICVIVAPNLEALHIVDDKISEIVSLCRTGPELAKMSGLPWNPIPVVFAATRAKLGAIRFDGGGKGNRKSEACQASVVGIFSADGAMEGFKTMVEQAKRLSGFYAQSVENEKRPLLCGACHKRANGSHGIRKQCMICVQDFCGPCTDRALAKKTPCGAGDGTSPCVMVRIVRAAPLGVEEEEEEEIVTPSAPLVKTLSAAAREFVPRG